MLMRQRSFNLTAMKAMNATRGGGGGPDLKPYKLTPLTRRYHLEDINSVLYGDFGAEFHMHLHSPWVAHSKQGIALCTIYFFLIVMPMWLAARWLQKQSGSILMPCVRPGSDHEHMAPRLFSHLKNNNADELPDKFGRMPATFYRNFTRADMSPEMRPKVVAGIQKHGVGI